MRPINLRESEIALANNTLIDSNSTYEDLGLTVYPKVGVNPSLWKNLRKQVKTDFPKVDLKEPFIITGLVDIVKSSNLENGLGFEFNELTEVYNAPILSKGDGKFNSDNQGLQKKGLPTKLNKKGTRMLYTANYGVRRLCRGRYLDLNFGVDDLVESYDGGRVHVIKNFQNRR